MGIYKRKLGNREASNRMLSRRSLHIAREMNVGEKINSEDIIVIRPGNGIEPKYYYNFVGKSVKIKLNKYDRLEWDHIDK